jgi:hypothetical protein
MWKDSTCSKVKRFTLIALFLNRYFTWHMFILQQQQHFYKMNRLASNSFNDKHCETFGADKFIKHITTTSKKCTLNIWCCGGHSRLRPILDQFYENAHVKLDKSFQD